MYCLSVFDNVQISQKHEKDMLINMINMISVTTYMDMQCCLKGLDLIRFVMSR